MSKAWRRQVREHLASVENGETLDAHGDLRVSGTEDELGLKVGERVADKHNQARGVRRHQMRGILHRLWDRVPVDEEGMPAITPWRRDKITAATGSINDRKIVPQPKGELVIELPITVMPDETDSTMEAFDFGYSVNSDSALETTVYSVGQELSRRGGSGRVIDSPILGACGIHIVDVRSPEYRNIE